MDDAALPGPVGTSPAVLEVHAASERPAAGFAKPAVDVVTLVVDHGVAGDVHAERALRQVHLVDGSRYALLRASGADLHPGDLGENVTTTGVDLLGLGTGARLRLGENAVVEVTGIRHPRHEDPTLDPDALHLDEDGIPVGRVGVFAVVLAAGEVRAGDPVSVLDAGASPLRPL
jgi:MOSC domain-containing protein YiiM